jgi:hypothetical protein
MPEEIIRDEEGNTFAVVQPGTAEDPFTSNRGTPSAPTPASPAVQPAGIVEMVVESEGPKNPTPTPDPTPTPVVPTPAPATPAPTETATPVATLTPLEQAIKEGKLEDYIATQVSEKATSALRAQQSAYDKKLQALEDERKAEREAALKRDREAKLASDELTEEEKELLKGKWELEDLKKELDDYADTLDEYYQEQLIVKLTSEYAKYGVSAEDLAVIDDPDEMIRFAETKELEFYRNGGAATAQIPTNIVSTETTPAEPAPVVPAGSQAPSDVAGNPTSAPPPEMDKGQGMDSLRNNLAAQPWVSIPQPN